MHNKKQKLDQETSQTIMDDIEDFVEEKHDFRQKAMVYKTSGLI